MPDFFPDQLAKDLIKWIRALQGSAGFSVNSLKSIK